MIIFQQHEGIPFKWEDFGYEILDSLIKMEEISDKLLEQIKVLNSRPVPKYYEDPDDPPIEKCITLSFIEYPDYHTTMGMVTFNLSYVRNKMNDMSYNYTQAALDETQTYIRMNINGGDAHSSMDQFLHK
jgi:peptidoglycan hydrolase-like protein with peptidoglycan-binding domain